MYIFFQVEIASLNETTETVMTATIGPVEMTQLDLNFGYDATANNTIEFWNLKIFTCVQNINVSD